MKNLAEISVVVALGGVTGIALKSAPVWRP
jgi:hypothetical protein